MAALARTVLAQKAGRRGTRALSYGSFYGKLSKGGYAEQWPITSSNTLINSCPVRHGGGRGY